MRDSKFPAPTHTFFMNYNEPVTIEVSVRQQHTGTDLRAGWVVTKNDLPIAEALAKLKTSNSAIGSLFDCQSDVERDSIKYHRHIVASEIAKALTDYLEFKVFAANDTYNGYEKELPS